MSGYCRSVEKGADMVAEILKEIIEKYVGSRNSYVSVSVSRKQVLRNVFI